MRESVFEFIVSSCECSLGSQAASDTRGAPCPPHAKEQAAGAAPA